MARIAGATVVQGTDLLQGSDVGGSMQKPGFTWKKTWRSLKKPGENWRYLKKSMVRTVIWKKPGLISEDS